MNGTTAGVMANASLAPDAGPLANGNHSWDVYNYISPPPPLKGLSPATLTAASEDLLALSQPR